MDPREEIWNRLQRHYLELINQCDQVESELEENRQARGLWHAATIAWKKIWLPKIQKETSIDVKFHT